MKKMNDEKSKQGSFVDHLTELRSRLVKSFIYLFICFIVSYFFAENIYRFLVEPYAEAVKDDPNNRRLIFTALHETFITYLKVAFFTAFAIIGTSENNSPTSLTGISVITSYGFFGITRDCP